MARHVGPQYKELMTGGINAERVCSNHGRPSALPILIHHLDSANKLN